MFSDLGYEVVIQPSMWVILCIAVLILFFRSFYREPVEVEGGITLKKLHVRGRKLAVAGVTLVAGALFISSLVVVPPGHRGAIYTPTGVDLIERGEGYSLIPPLVYNANMVNVREQLYETVFPEGHDKEGESNLFAQSKDFLEFTMRVGVNYVVEPDKAADIFRDVGQEYEAAIIKPAVEDISKLVLGQHVANEIPQKREEIRRQVFEQVSDRLDDVGIRVTFLAVEDVLGPEEWRAAVEAKEIAGEQIIEQERLALAKEHEADGILNLAVGEAEAQERLAEAEDYQRELLGMTPAQYLLFRTWNGIVPQFWVGGEGETPFDFLIDPSALPQQSSDSEDE